MLLGATVRDKVTGFTGVVTGFVQYLSGCNQVLVVPPIKEDGSLPDPQWFDVQRVDAQATPLIVLDNGSTPGFDRAPPVR
jgi:hypothetical protein